jgi:hypothetical protein
MTRRLTITLVLLGTAAGLTACGSSTPGSGSSGDHAKFLAFAKCVRANGVPNFPDPSPANGGGLQISAQQRAGSGQTMTVNGTPVSAPAFKSAMRRCRSKLPKGGKPSAQQIAQLRKQALTMARCMRAHGVTDFPDPKVQRGPGGGVGIDIGPGLSKLNANSPAFQAASKVCMKGGGALFKAPAPGSG